MKKFFACLASCVRSGYKRALVALGLLGVAASAHAEGENNAIDFSAATTALSDIKTAIVQWVNTNAPVLVAILCGFLVITLIFLVVKWFKRGSSKA